MKAPTRWTQRDPHQETLQLKWQKLKTDNLKSSKKQQPVTCKETPRVLSVYFLVETSKARRELHGIFKLIKGEKKKKKTTSLSFWL